MDGASRGGGMPGAEVEEVWPRGGRILLRLSLVGTGAEGATLVLRVRGAGGAELQVRADGSGHRFEACLPLAPLVAAGGDVDAWVWDLYLVPDGSGGEALRLGKHLDDVRGKKHIFRYPVQHAARTAVEPYFTAKDNLSISCRRGAAGRGAAR
ncbi:hypothetical protein [Streptomyces boncukensis]|uniref:Transferase n=1 Tax=Streptomyces boncukensis TaxID=2711219 RepID=A0A6G4WUS2_9ACTN|nr:hypothetical protein [Streptomyces boncukensis]NGO68602.1 hypothetical protein [Streptomyces boncukensis]